MGSPNITCLTNLQRNPAKYNLKWGIEKEVIIFIHRWDLVIPIHFHFNDNIVFQNTCSVGFLWILPILSLWFLLFCPFNQVIYLYFILFSVSSVIFSFSVPNSCWQPPLTLTQWFISSCGALLQWVVLFMGLSYALSCKRVPLEQLCISFCQHTVALKDPKHFQMIISQFVAPDLCKYYKFISLAGLRFWFLIGTLCFFFFSPYPKPQRTNFFIASPN